MTRPSGCHKDPTVAVVKTLYGTSSGCGVPDCPEPLYRTEGTSQDPILNSRVAHIRARCPKGPRWDPTQSESDNRALPNLILLCLAHAAEVDDPAHESRYPISRLLAWKNSQRKRFEKNGGGIRLTSKQVAEIRRLSFPRVRISIRNSTVSLGGEGGRALGAAGGGGGAIGPGALGGRGGDAAKVSLDGQPGQAPGAGGGGGGAIGDLAKGAEGGSGGELRTGLFKVADLPRTIPIKVGRGGNARPGQDGEDGEDTSFGDLLVAKGGKGGKAGFAVGDRPITDTDLASGFRVTALQLANCVNVQGGLLHLLGAGWSTYSVQSLPFDALWPLACSVSLGAFTSPFQFRLAAIALDPSGTEVARHHMSANSGVPQPCAVINLFAALRVNIASAGLWSVRLVSDELDLASLPLEVRLLTQGQPK